MIVQQYLSVLELGCELVIKSTKVDGVYDKDPNKYDDAVKFDTISYQQALENPEIKVMDKSAMGLAAEQGVKVVVMNLHEPDGLIRLVNGEHVGTLIS
jgi:uridylate kinase